MKRIFSLIVSLLFLHGCASGSNPLSAGMSLREKLMGSSGCTFDAMITADFGDSVYVFRMACEADKDGTLRFEVLEPESIGGICGTTSASGGQLEFDDVVLGFPLLADGALSPVSGPWLLIRSLLSGYMKNEGRSADGICLTIDDSYREGALQLSILLNEQGLPAACDVYFRGLRVLSMKIENFRIV